MWRRYGQHFLSDTDVLDHIAETVFQMKEELWSTKLIEIWPGKGILTELIIDSFEQVTLYEIDTSMKFLLEDITKDHPSAEIVWGDVLEEKRDQIKDNREEALIVGNLPYYITSPILRKFFEEGSYPWGVFLVQREVAEKLDSTATKKSFLRRLINFSYEVTYVFPVSAQAFDPPPRVESGVISLRRKTPDKRKKNIDFQRMLVFLDAISGLKRKTLGKIWKMRAEKLDWFVLPEDLRGQRIEQLGWKEMWRIVG